MCSRACWMNASKRMDSPGSLVPSTTTFSTGQSSIDALAVDATSIYWTNSGTSGNDYKDGVVMKLTPK